MLKKLVNYFIEMQARRSSAGIINWYRKKGIRIGERSYAMHPKSLMIDISKPSLIEIGDHVFLHRGLNILSHDYSTWVFVDLYSDFLPSTGRVKIGNNVWFGYNCTVLKGVTIGDNCIIGLGSVVSKDIPANSVAAGSPAKVICTIEEYYQKRKRQYVSETISYARSIKEVIGREPKIEDFLDDYPCFVDGRNYRDYPNIPYNVGLKQHFSEWKKRHKAEFYGFEEFLNEVNKV